MYIISYLWQTKRDWKGIRRMARSRSYII